MVKLLEETPDTVAEDALDAVMTEMEEREARARFAQTPPSRGGNDPDLSDGGVINGARLTPMNNGRPVEKGRAVARRAWTWNGSETVLPLAWNPDGTVHDGGRRGPFHPDRNNGRPVEKGRAVARRAWTWNGSETVLPLAWNPDGTVHDGGRRGPFH